MAYQPKSYRKFLAGTVSAALVASAIGPVVAGAATEFSDVSASNSHYVGITALTEAGLINGYQDGTFKPSAEISRGAVVKIMSRLIDGTGELEQVFTDLPVDGDEELVRAAYEVYNAGYVTGANGKLLAANSITREQMAKVLVEAFKLKGTDGYVSTITDLDLVSNTEYVAYIKVLEENGITVVADGKFRPSEKVSRGQFATFVSRALAKVVAPIATPEVTEVSSSNLKEVVVSFNKEISSANVKADQFSVKNNTVANVKVSEDKKSVVLTLGTAIAQQAEVEVTAKTTVAFEDKSVLAAEVVKTLTITDVTIPVAESITLTGPNTFEVKFSEPVQAGAGADVAVNNGVYGVASKTLSTDGRTLTVQLSASSVVEATYQVKVSGYTDYAPFAAMAKTFDLVYTKDTSAPSVKLVSAAQNEVVVEFDKAVTKKGGAALDANYFYQTYSAWKPVAVTTTDNKKFTLSFSDNNAATQDFILPEGNVTVTVLKSAGEVAIVDMWGNELAADAKLAATVTADKTAPTATKVEAKAENQLVVTFSEKVTVAAANFAIKDSAGKAILPTITGVTFDNDKLTATIDLSAKLSGGNYTVDIKDVTDTSLSSNKIQPITLTVAVSDKTAMDLSTATATVVDNATAKEQYVYVTFPEAVDPTSALNKSNYLVAGTALASSDKVELFGTDNKRVKMTVKYRGTTPAAVITAGTSQVTFGRIADASGNIPTALSTNKLITVETAPTSFTAKAIATNKLVLEFAGELKTVVADGIEIDGNNDGTFATAAAIDSVEVKDGKTLVTVTTKAAEASANKSAAERNKISVKVVNDKLETITGQKLTGVTAVAATEVKDGIAPELESTDPVTLARTSATVASITVDFDEDLAALNALAATDLVVKDANGKEYVAGTNYTVALAGGDASKLVVTLTFANETDLDALNNTKFSVATKATVNYLVDASANKVKVFETKQTKTALADN